jgi:hypothetical protein
MVSDKTSKKNMSIIFFGQKVTEIEINTSGDFFLHTEQSYHVSPFQNLNADGKFCLDQVKSRADLLMLDQRINLTSVYNTSVKVAYAITWSINVTTKLALYQVVLLMDNKNQSFMMVNYARLDIPSDATPSFFYDTELQDNSFNGSVTDTNCGVSGQFIFQLNSIKQQNSKRIFL